MKLWERVVEARLRKVVEICEQQYGFMPRKSTTDAIFALRILVEKYRDGQRELHCVFVDLEKAYDRVPREELWYCMRKSGVAEKYVRVVQDMYERSRTVVRCAVGQTEEFNVEVGLHQGSALSPFLFAMVMDQLSEEVRQESPWTMMFADDIVICSESREQVEENLERWRFVLERRGMKVSGSKTEYMCVNEREGSGTVRLQGEEVKKVQEFKYLGSTVQSNGECGKEVKKRVQAGWNGWRKVWGVLCDRKISARIKGKVYRTVVRAAMLYGLETVSLRKRQESELEVAELKMLRFSLGVTRLDRIRNEYIRGTAHVGRFGDKVREARLRWFGHVQRRETYKIIRHILTDMKTRLIVVVAFVCTVCHFTEAQLLPVTPLNANITNTACGITKLCVSSVANCNPTGNSSCFFASTQYNNGMLTVEMSGTTSGYVALGLTPTVSPLSQISIINIPTVQGSVTSNQTLIQCIINITVSPNILGLPSLPANVQLPVNLSILNGSTNGTSLGIPTTVFNSNGTLDLADPKSNVSPTVLLNITRTGCGSTKLCVSNESNCDPAGNSSCFFSSVQVKNQTLSFELSGTTTGYVALGLANQNTTYSFQGVVSQNPNRVQCIFNTSTSLNFSVLRSASTSYNVTVMNGSFNGTSLGIPTTVFNSNGTLDLADPKSNVSPTVLLNITRTGCGSTKLCVSNESNCDPAGNSSCFFSSVQVKNQTLSFELSGTTTGYVALGLIKQNSTFVFVCGNNSNSFFFQTATQNNTNLTSANVTTVHNFQGVVAQNQTLIQCIFNTSTSFNISTKAVDTMYQVIIMNGTTNGTSLGIPTTVFNSNGTLDLADPKSNVSPTVLLNITRTGCGSTKLCVSNESNCDPAGNSSCFFSSVQVKNQTLSFELSGTTTGYVALGLIKQNSTFVFVCGNNSNSFFFQTATQNNTNLTSANVTTVHNFQGVVAQNQTLIQCIFNTSTSFNISTKAVDTMYQVIIMNGTTNVTSNQTLIQCIINITVSPNIFGLPSLPANVQLPVNLSILNGSTNGTQLGTASTVFNSDGTLDLANPMSNAPALNITRTGCGSTKLCVSNESNCDPAGNSSCFFSSVQVKNQTLSFELSGTTTGYVALGLIKQNSTFVFVCGNNSNSFFFQTATQNNTNLTSANVTTVHNFQGVVAQNQTLIQCIFNTSTSFNISTKAVDTMYQVIIMNGTTNVVTLSPATRNISPLSKARLPMRQTLAPPKKSGPAMGPGEELGT
ncbi:hypothetical protein QTP86_008531 [Hemibagrus guttatus]|nr:hypothetical protein QTP86_008531 [Hemibagrus guttatus]